MLQQDNQQNSSQNYARGFFRKLEIEEVKALAKAPDPSAVELRYVERFHVETPLIRTQIPTSVPDNTRYVGLASNGVYDCEGNLVGDAFSLYVRATAGHKRYAKLFTNPLRFNESDDPLEGDSLTHSSTTEAGVDEEDEEHAEEDDRDEDDDGDNDNDNDNDHDDEHDDDDDDIEAAQAAGEELDSEVAPTTALYERAVRIESLAKTTIVGRLIVAMNWGCHQLPRNTTTPRFMQDSPQTTQLVEGTSPVSSELPISDAARRILARSNYHQPLALEQNPYDDQHVNHHFLRRRSIQCLTTVMYTSLFKKQYDHAFKALCLLMRERRVDLRLLWSPALELLAWRVREHGARKTPVDFLDWLIANFPELSNHKVKMYRQLARAPTFIPVQIMIRLSLGQYRAAADQAEQVVNSAKFNSDARCWAYYGIALLKLDMDRNAEKAERCFQMCVKLGGVMSSIISDRESTGTQSDSESAGSEPSADESDNASEAEEASSSSSGEEQNSEEEYTEAPPAKRAKRDTLPEDIPTNGRNDELENKIGSGSGSESDDEGETASQPFYSQGGPIGTELGLDADSEEDVQDNASQPFYSQGGPIGTQLGSDSESDDDGGNASQPFYSQGGPIGTELGSESDDGSGHELSSQPFYTQVEPTGAEADSSSENDDKSGHASEPESEPESDPENDPERLLASDGPSNSQSEDDSEKSEHQDSNEDSNEAGGEEPELASSQPFYSQGGIGAEMGSSESEIDV